MRQAWMIGWLVLATTALSAAETTSNAKADTDKPGEANVDFSYSPNWPEPPNTNGMLLRLGFGTVVTLGLCAGTLILGRRWLQRPTVGDSTRQLQIEESLVLGHRAMLFLVKVGETQLIAGTDAGGLKSLIVLPTPFHEVLDQQVEVAEVNTAIPPVAVWKPDLEQAA